MECHQDDEDEPFIDYEGSMAEDCTLNISTAQGDRTTPAGPWQPTNPLETGFIFVGCVRVEVNGSDYWMPFFDCTTIEEPH